MTPAERQETIRQIATSALAYARLSGAARAAVMDDAPRGDERSQALSIAAAAEITRMRELCLAWDRATHGGAP